jgi:hypothetical protein
MPWISADGQIDLPWIPPDLFTANASAALRDRRSYVTTFQFDRIGAKLIESGVASSSGARHQPTRP